MRQLVARYPAADMRIDPELVERFRADLFALYDAVERPNASLVVAVSGGADSLALLMLAAEAHPGRVYAVTVDHGLRGESASEAAHVSRLCQQFDIPHRTLLVTVPEGNVQSGARAARYSAIAAWMNETLEAGSVLMTAHHADDQVETLILRLNRSSGLSGLAGVRPSRTFSSEGVAPVTIVRPLLSWRRAELEDILRNDGVDWVSDPSNTDDRFDRARLRKHLANVDWIDPCAWTKSASLLAEAAAFIAEAANAEFRSQVSRIEEGYRYVPTGHDLVVIEVVTRIFREMGREVTRSEIERLVSRLQHERNASLAGVLARAIKDVSDQLPRVWNFQPEPPRRTG